MDWNKVPYVGGEEWGTGIRSYAMLARVALLPCRFELISCHPLHTFRLSHHQPAQFEPEAGNVRIAGEVHAVAVDVGGCVVFVRAKVAALLPAPFGVMAHKGAAFAHRERRHTHAGQAEVVAPKVAAAGVRSALLHGEVVLLCERLEQRIHRGAF